MQKKTPLKYGDQIQCNNLKSKNKTFWVKIGQKIVWLDVSTKMLPEYTFCPFAVA